MREVAEEGIEKIVVKGRLRFLIILLFRSFETLLTCNALFSSWIFRTLICVLFLIRGRCMGFKGGGTKCVVEKEF